MKRREAANADWLTMLGQGKWWRTAAGETIKVKSMTQAHRLSLLSTLERRCDDLARSHRNALARELARLLLMVPSYYDGAEASCAEAIWAGEDEDGIESEIDRWENHPYVMLRSTPLYAALLDASVNARLEERP